MRTMKTWIALVAGVFVGLGTEHAWATITTAAGNVSSANGSLTIGTGGTLNVPLSAGITYPGGNTISVGIGFTGFDFNNEVNATLTTGVGFNSHEASGNCGFQNDTAGAEVCVGPGTNMYWKQDANGNLSAGGGAAYVASATPFTLSAVYVNNTIAAFTYGGAALPARAFKVTDISFYVRTSASGCLSAQNNFRVTDGTNVCDCNYNPSGGDATGPRDVVCVGTGGTGCVYAASALLTYQYAAVPACTSNTDISGNIDVRGIWQ